MVGVGQTDGLQCLVRTYQNIEGQSFCKNYTMDTYQDQERQFSVRVVPITNNARIEAEKKCYS